MKTASHTKPAPFAGPPINQIHNRRDEEYEKITKAMKMVAAAKPKPRTGPHPGRGAHLLLDIVGGVETFTQRLIEETP